MFALLLLAIGAQGAHAATAVAAAPLAPCPSYPPDTRLLDTVVRDFTAIGQTGAVGGPQADMAPATAGDDRGALNPTLDAATLLPHLASTAAHPTIQSEPTFQQWWTDTPANQFADGSYAVYLQQFAFSNAHTCNDLVYQVDENPYYPVDGQGFGHSPGQTHNDYFTTLTRARFTYQGIENLTITTSDDAWVFINNQLAIDLGGIHGPESAGLDLTYPAGGCAGTSSAVSACRLGLTPGSSFPIDVFYAHRSTGTPELELTTSLLLQDPYPLVAPTLTLPADQTVQATGSQGVAVTYNATAVDEFNTALIPTCSPASGATFPVGTTTVHCTVTDRNGLAASGRFQLIVQANTGGSDGTGGNSGTATPELGSGELLATGLLPVLGVLFYRRRARRIERDSAGRTRILPPDTVE